MAKEPLVIKRMKRLAELSGCAYLMFHDNNLGKYYSLSSAHSPKSTFPETYQELLKDLANRIIKEEAANGR